MIGILHPARPLRIFWGEVHTIRDHFEKAEANRTELVADASFDNGNAIVRYIDQAPRPITAEPYQVNRSVNIWWHFRIDGIEPGKFITLPTNHSPIAGDCPPAYSCDGVYWQRMRAAVPPFVQRFNHNSVEAPRNIPYPYGGVEAFCI